MAAAKGGLTIAVTVNPRDIARIEKRLDKWQGKPLETRLAKATSGAMSITVGPLRSAAPVSPDGHTGKRPHPSGNLRRRIRMRTLKKRKGEVAAAYAGTANYYGLWVQQGKGPGERTANPFVAQVHQQMEPAIRSFIDHEVRKLA